MTRREARAAILGALAAATAIALWQLAPWFIQWAITGLILGAAALTYRRWDHWTEHGLLAPWEKPNSDRAFARQHPVRRPR